jgi:4a-hydroxytetrahydrobiopterin dehydratase
MPERLSESALQAALEGLPDWTGGAGRIRRTVQAGDGKQRLLSSVGEAADAMNHHPVVHEGEAGAVTFEVWTHSVGGVTELDVELARRIDSIIGGP